MNARIMKTPEGKITDKIKKYLQELKKAGAPVFYFKVHGGPIQQAGIPDWHILYDGAPHYLEVKAPGKKASRLQQHIMNQIAEAGGITCIVTSLEEVKAILSR